MSASLRSRLSSALRSARAGCIAFLSCLLVLLPNGTPRVHAQSASAVQQLQASLQRARELLTASERLLEQQTLDIASLRSSLAQAARELIDSRSEIESLRADLARAAGSQQALGGQLSKMQSSYDELTRRYETLSISFNQYRTEMSGQVQSLKNERDAAIRSGAFARRAAVIELVLLLALGGAIAAGALQFR